MSEDPIDTSVPDAAGPGADGVPVGEGCEAGEPPAYCTYTSYEYAEGSVEGDVPATGEDADGLAAEVWDALYGVEDPEMPVSVVDLGLIYGVEITERADGDGPHVRVDMTLTYTGCPARDMLTDEIEAAAASPDGVADAEVRLVWSPEWSLEMVTEQGKRDLQEFGLSV
jgi:metal-sulfur cluster biosynthetic enzyme